MINQTKSPAKNKNNLRKTFQENNHQHTSFASKLVAQNLKNTNRPTPKTIYNRPVTIAIIGDIRIAIRKITMPRMYFRVMPVAPLFFDLLLGFLLLLKTQKCHGYI